jgi:quercetin dioxygenase-like cupin family protein
MSFSWADSDSLFLNEKAMRIRFLHNSVPVLVAPVGGTEQPFVDPPEDPEIGTAGVGSIQLVRNHFPRSGMWAPGHHHLHDHLMLLTAGAVELVANGLITKYEADHIIIIPKQTRHQIRALRDDTTIWCVAALRDGETGEVIGEDDFVDRLQPMTEEFATALGMFHVAATQQTT